MEQYISKQATLADLNKTYNNMDGFRPEFYSGFQFAVSIVRNFTKADVTPVRHGRWEWLGPNELVRGCMCGTCSACKVRSKYIVNTGICPNCGARMDLGGTDNGE